MAMLWAGRMEIPQLMFTSSLKADLLHWHPREPVADAYAHQLTP